MPNLKKTEELTLKLLKGQPTLRYEYFRPAELTEEERFFKITCRQTRDSNGNQVPLLDKDGNPVFNQLQYFLDSDTEVLNEEQKQMLLQDPRYRDPATGEIKKFPYKQLISITRVLTEVDGRKWLIARWMWEGLRRDKGIQTKAFKTGDYNHPMPVNELKPINPNDKEAGYRSVITAINHKRMFEIPFTKENYDKVLAERSGPRDERHINMSLSKIDPSGSAGGFALEVKNREQFLTRPFMELWDYLASAPDKNTENTRIGKEKDREKNRHYG